MTVRTTNYYEATRRTPTWPCRRPPHPQRSHREPQPVFSLPGEIFLTSTSRKLVSAHPSVHFTTLLFYTMVGAIPSAGLHNEELWLSHQVWAIPGKKRTFDKKLLAIWYYSSIFCKWWDFGGMSSFYTEIGGIHPTGDRPKPRPTTPHNLLIIMIFLYQSQNSYLHVESKS